MRVSAGQLRDLVRLGVGWHPPPPGPVTITSPASIRNKAIALYHHEGHSAALAYLAGRRGDGTKGLASGYYGPGGPKETYGQRTATCLHRYFRYDVADAAPYAEVPLKGDVPLGIHTVSASVDAVMFHPKGYVGRLLNWDRAGLESDDAELIAVAAALLIEQELGAGTCAHIAVWDLEHSRQFEIDGRYALGQAPTLQALMDRVA